MQEVIGKMTIKDFDCLYEVAPSSFEGRVTLQIWWRIAKRACQIHGLFRQIRAQKSQDRVRKRYANIVAAIEGAQNMQGRRLLKFAQASRYDRVGKFLADFPCFLFQRQWVTLADWFHKVGDHVFLDCVTSLVPISSVFLRDCFRLHEQGFQVHADMIARS